MDPDRVEPGIAGASVRSRVTWLKERVFAKLMRLTMPHRAITVPRERRVLRLIAAWHLLGVPVGPLIALHCLALVGSTGCI